MWREGGLNFHGSGGGEVFVDGMVERDSCCRGSGSLLTPTHSPGMADQPETKGAFSHSPVVFEPRSAARQNSTGSWGVSGYEKAGTGHSSRRGRRTVNVNRGQ
jgi:hypothetical protein